MPASPWSRFWPCADSGSVGTSCASRGLRIEIKLWMAESAFARKLPVGQSPGSPKSCLVAGEDDEKASQRISEIPKVRLPTDPNQFTDAPCPDPERGVSRPSRPRVGDPVDAAASGQQWLAEGMKL